MVCSKCQKKLDKLVTPDVWKDGARNTIGGNDGGRKLGMNMLLKNRAKNKFSPFGGGKFASCKACKKKLLEKSMKYCKECSYKKGRCQSCGVKVLKTKMYRQSNV